MTCLTVVTNVIVDTLNCQTRKTEFPSYTHKYRSILRRSFTSTRKSHWYRLSERPYETTTTTALHIRHHCIHTSYTSLLHTSPIPHMYTYTFSFSVFFSLTKYFILFLKLPLMRGVLRGYRYNPGHVKHFTNFLHTISINKTTRDECHLSTSILHQLNFYTPFLGGCLKIKNFSHTNI